MQGYWKDGRYILASTLEEKITRLEAKNIDLKQKATYWEAKANEYKAILENMERVEHYPHTTNSG